MKFDESFLAEVGLSDLPEDQKKPFLEYAQEQLEFRVGEEMSTDLTPAQIEEFQGIMNNDQQVIRKIVAELGMDFREDETYKRILARHGVTEGTWEIIGEYLSVKWIQKNRPDYRDVVSRVAETLKAEIRSDAPQILADAKN